MTVECDVERGCERRPFAEMYPKLLERVSNIDCGFGQGWFYACYQHFLKIQEHMSKEHDCEMPWCQAHIPLTRRFYYIYKDIIKKVKDWRRAQ